jgi:hypothetical protein
MLNSILFCVLLAGIGACYVWLGVKKRNLADQIYGMDREIRELQQLIDEKEGQIHRRLAPEDLQSRAVKAGLELKPIDIGPKGRLYRLPEPEPGAGLSSPSDTLVSAGKFIP